MNAHSATVSAASTQQQVQAVVDLQQQQKCAEGEQGVAEEDGGSGDGAEAAKGVRPISSNPAHPYTHTIQGLLAAYNPSSPTPASPSTSTPDATLTSATTSADSAPPMQQPVASSTQSQQQSLQKEESAASSRQQQQQQQQQKGQQVLHLLLLRPPVFPAAAEDTQFVMVTTPAQLESMTRHLWQVDAFALDIEHHARRCYLGITCLLQISTGDVDYVIDALALHDHLGDALRPIFASPQILKVLHGCSQDVLWLQRDFHLYLVHVFDTEQAAMALGRKARSLASLTLAYCHTELDKSYQSAGWRKRPLPEDFVTYAHADVRYLLYLCGVLSMELRGLRPPAQPHTQQQQQQQQQQQPLYQPSPQHPIPAKLATALYRSQLLTLQLYTKPRHDAVVSAAATALLRHAMVQHQQTQQAQEQAATQPQQDSGGTVTGQAAIHESEEEQQQQEARRGSSLHASTSSVNTSTAKIDSGSETPQGSTHGTLWGVPDYYRLHQRLLALCDWRDSQARKDDESPQYVLPDTMLLALALAAPTTAAGVKEVLHSHVPEPPARGGDMLSRAAFSQASHLAECIQGKHTPMHLLSPTLAQASEGSLDRGVDGTASIEQLLSSLGLQRPKTKRGSKFDELPEEKRQQMIKKFSSKGVVYENCIMLSKAGELLCHTDRSKVEWYLNRGIAEKVQDEPLTIRLLFEHKKTDQEAGDRFYSQQKANRCVVCGEEEHYLRFRVVPMCYRRQFPIHLKSHRSHDVVLLCVRCHQVALKAAESTKREIATEYGIPLEPVLPNTGKAEKAPQATVDPIAVRRAAGALCQAAPRMPQSRREELSSAVRRGLELSGWERPSDDSPEDPILPGMLTKVEMEAGLTFGLGPKKPKSQHNEGDEEGEDSSQGGGHMWHGQKVVEKILQQEGEMGLNKGLIRRFRETFVRACQPRFLPHRWDVGHAAIRQFGPHSVYAPQPLPPQPIKTEQ